MTNLQSTGQSVSDMQSAFGHSIDRINSDTFFHRKLKINPVKNKKTETENE